MEQRAADTREQARQAQIDADDARLNDLIAQWDQFTADRKQEIETMLNAGEITAAAARKIRLWHLPPERPLLPAPSPPELSAAPPARESPPPPTPEPETQ